MKTYQYDKLSKQEIQNLCQRKGIDTASIQPLLQEIQENIRSNSDDALREYTKKFDGVILDSLIVSGEKLSQSKDEVSEKFKKACTVAIENIKKFHTAQMEEKIKIETTKGVFCWRESRAIEKIGIYIPAGTASLFSTLLMAIIPAQIAGCREIAICTPPNKNGEISPEILYITNLLNINLIYKVGGAQAIFALANGTETIPKVDKIFGPGNKYVTEAKIMVSNFVAIDMPAGPSEVLVIADEKSNPVFVASDLLSQAEHGADSESILITNSQEKSIEILKELKQQLSVLPRKEIAEKALENSFIVITKDIDEAFKFSNIYAPEHLILSFDNFEKYLSKIINAGSVFCGKFSCESFGDYASGTNHILPTSGFARNFSGVSLDSFVKKITFQQITKEGLLNLGETVEILAETEQLQGHKNAVTVRLKSL